MWKWAIFRSHCRLKARKLGDAGSYITWLTVSQYSVTYFAWLEASIFRTFAPPWSNWHECFNHDSTAGLFFPHSGPFGGHTMWSDLMYCKRERRHQDFSISHYRVSNFLWAKCLELESPRRSARQQWYFAYICSRLTPLLFLHLLFIYCFCVLLHSILM